MYALTALQSIGRTQARIREQCSNILPSAEHSRDLQRVIVIAENDDVSLEREASDAWPEVEPFTPQLARQLGKSFAFFAQGFCKGQANGSIFAGLGEISGYRDQVSLRCRGERLPAVTCQPRVAYAPG